jgi:hypothetical protein
MIFVRAGAKAGATINAGRLERSAFATINPQGGMAGFMVRSQLRKLDLKLTLGGKTRAAAASLELPYS